MSRLRPAGLVVEGIPCHGAMSRSIPLDKQYYLTSFGGGSDTQPVACGGQQADGTWWYAADSQRFGCNSLLRIANPANGRSCIVKVVDAGPDICVEQAAGMPIIDASPLVAQYLFNVRSAGYADRRLIVADVVDPSLPLGPEAQGVIPDVPWSGTGLVGLALIAMGVGSYLYLEHNARTSPRHNPTLRFGVSDARAAVRVLDLKLGKIPIEELATGMNVELEHSGRLGWKTNVTNGDPVLTARIAWAHLKEHPDYYRRLLKAGLMERSERVR